MFADIITVTSLLVDDIDIDKNNFFEYVSTLISTLEDQMNGTEKSEMGKPMYEGPDGFTAVVTHSVEPSGFPSQIRGPALIVYCIDEQGNVRVEPRVLSVGGVGVYRGPMFRTQDLRDGVVSEDPAWFSDNDIPFTRWRELAIQNAPDTSFANAI